MAWLLIVERGVRACTEAGQGAGLQGWGLRHPLRAVVGRQDVIPEPYAPALAMPVGGFGTTCHQRLYVVSEPSALLRG